MTTASRTVTKGQSLCNNRIAGTVTRDTVLASEFQCGKSPKHGKTTRLNSYLITYRYLWRIPDPFSARFSDLWLLRACRFGRRYAVVDRIHSQLGLGVRIQPNHVSINVDEAIYTIYDHGSGLLKSPFYEAFVSIRRGIFTTHDRADHTHKRKIISHTFSPRSASQFEPYVNDNIETFIQQWDALAQQHGTSGARLNALHWFNYLAFDIIDDLAFGAPFGMLKSDGDTAEMRPTPDSPAVMVPAIQVLNRPCFLPDPFLSHGLQAVDDLAGIAIAQVQARLEAPADTITTRSDLLQRLSEGRDDKGQPLSREELTAEALIQLIAGSDTVANTLTAIMYYVAGHPEVVRKLRVELDVAIPPSSAVVVSSFDVICGLPYLRNVIYEPLRTHSTSGIGLPRQIPDESSGIWISRYFFPPGTVLIRWERVTARQKNAFIPFSHGSRACVGRNVAEMELKLILAEWVRRYDVTVAQDGLEIHEGFLRKPVKLDIVLSKREIL
ncbi:cytochrome P450 [Immersiella caudata]|uniref:Cytochrome P450 n=1 Tax=Immersiella caudata TaxID=314043 RepID=A0AA39WYD9_9PEZI|nr:cytochrome P450 [Immersiella caudata]